MQRFARAWGRLPRDGRDTLFQLGVIAWTLVPHVAHLPAWCSVLAAAMLGWRARVAVKSGALPGRWAVIAVLALAAGLTWWGEGTLLGKEAGVTMLVVLMTLKTLELRARRDALVVFFLGFFLVLTNFLYSQTLLVAASMLLSVWGLLAALVLAHMPVGRPAIARAGALAARAALLGAPVMIALFLLFPRLGPLWGTPQDAIGRTGLSGSLRLGGLADIANDDTIALRIRFEGPVPPPEALYFRGPVLGSFDGTDWTRQRSQLPLSERARAGLEVRGTGVRYEMTVEPSRLAMLPLLEATPDRADSAPQVEGWPAALAPDLQWVLDRPLSERVRFQARAWTSFRHGPRDWRPGLDEWLALPAGFNPRTVAWARALRADPALANADARQLAQHVLRHIRDGDYHYTLEPGPYGRDAIDEFWLDRRVGFCEHYAATFVVIMRALGVPARIVAGYQGTDEAPVDGWWIVRESNAHAWAEIWERGSGWQRVDPTAAVSPERISRRGSYLQRRPGFVADAIRNVSPALADGLRDAWEAVNNRWNQWVLNYSRREQFDLLRGLGISSPDWADLANLLIGLMATSAAAGAGWAWWDRRRQDPWQRLQRRVQQRLARLGVDVGSQHAPGERARRVRAALGAKGEAVAAELEALERQRYAQPGPPRPDRRWWPRFAGAARGL